MILLLGLTLDDYIKEVRKHPSILSAKKMSESYSGRSLKSLFPPPPTLTYNAMFMPGAVSVSQPLPLAWPFNALALKEEERASTFNYESFENNFLLEAINAYLDAYYLGEKVKVLERMLGNLKLAEKSVSQLYRVGKADKNTLQRLRARIELLESDLQITRGEIKAKNDMLKFFYGQDVDSLLPPEPDSLPPLNALMERVKSSPSLRGLYHEKRASELKRKAALLSIVPTVAPGVLYRNGSLSFAVSLAIPIWLPAYFGNLRERSRKAEGESLKYESWNLQLISLLSSEYGKYVAYVGSKRRLENSLKELELAYRSELDRYRTTAKGTTDYLYVQNEILTLRLELLKTDVNIARTIYTIKALLGDI